MREPEYYASARLRIFFDALAGLAKSAVTAAAACGYCCTTAAAHWGHGARNKAVQVYRLCWILFAGTPLTRRPQGGEAIASRALKSMCLRFTCQCARAPSVLIAARSGAAAWPPPTPADSGAAPTSKLSLCTMNGGSRREQRQLRSFCRCTRMRLLDATRL